jgi:hypothetical protein
VESNWVHSARRPLIGLLYLPWVIMMMENLVEWKLAGETEVNKFLRSSHATREVNYYIDNSSELDSILSQMGPARTLVTLRFDRTAP